MRRGRIEPGVICRAAAAASACIALSALAAGPARADVSINDVSVSEGGSGTVNAVFEVHRTFTGSDSTVLYNTVPATASEPGDYEHTEGAFKFSSTDPGATITVPVRGDTESEGDETFTVVLRARGEQVTDGEGVGTILNDDGCAAIGGGVDTDRDGIVDACDTNDDNDAFGDGTDACPLQAGRGAFGCPLPPPPVLGQSVNIHPLSGEIFVRLPRGASTARARSAQKGQGFIPLKRTRQVPVGSLFDARRGKLRIVSATSSTGRKYQSGEFFAGLFQVLQSRSSRARGMTEVRSKGASFRSCRSRGRGSANAAARRRLSRRTINRLRGSVRRGRFRTRGRYSAATVRGTKWVTADRCDGTLTKVTRGKVAVRDFRRRRSVLLRAGKSYLARP